MKSEVDRIGTYEVRERLGAGGMGEVFLAWDARLERQVAIKRMLPDSPMTEERQLRFRLEARAVASLNHPAIVQVHDILEDPSGDCIVMEYVEGQSLAELQATGTLTVKKALDLAHQIAQGLASAHQQGFVHRDLKGENVMVSPSGQAKILDFGLAKRLEGQELHESLTRGGTVLGTVRVMSPEQASGEQVDRRSDLYSLGVLLYEMLTGLSPFRGENILQVQKKILTETPASPQFLRPELSGELSNLVESLLEKDPGLRPQNAVVVEEILARLKESPQLSKLGPPPSRSNLHASSDASTAFGPPEPPRPGVDLEPGCKGGEPAAKPDASAAVKLLKSASRFRRWLITGLWVLAFFSLVLAAPGPRKWLLSDPGSTSPAADSKLAKTPFELYQLGNRYLERFDKDGYLEQAIDYFEQAIAIDSSYAPGYSALARAFWRRFRASPDATWLRRAYDNARIAVDLDPRLSHGRVTLAWIQITRGELESARRTLIDLRTFDPSNADVLRGLADLATLAGNQEAAADLYREAIQLNPTDWELHGELAVILQRNGAYEASAVAFEASLELAPDHPLLHSSLGAVYYYQGKWSEAVAEFQRSIEIRPSAPGYSNLGTLYFFQGEYREAASAFEQAVRLGPNDDKTWSNLGDAYRVLSGRKPAADDAFMQAEVLLRRLLEEQPGSLELRSRLVINSAKRGACEAVRAELGKIKDLASSSAAEMYRIAMAHELCGARDEALGALSQALEAGFSPTQVRDEPDLVFLREDVRYHQLMLQFTDRGAEPS